MQLEEMNSTSEVKLVDLGRDKADSVQSCYNIIEEAINQTLKAVGSYKQMLQTNNKLTSKTKNLIKRKVELNNESNKTLQDKFEFNESRKLIKKEIRRDTRDFEAESII